jgi:hypothetical protein
MEGLPATQKPIWFEQLLRDLGLKKSTFDDCLYYNDNLSLILLIYVDDVLVVTEDEKRYDELVTKLNNMAELSAGQLTLFLGMRTRYEPHKGVARLDQEQYIKRLLVNWHDRLQSGRNPVDMRSDYESEPVPYELATFKQLLGSLIYLSIATRPDIANAVNLASRTAVPTRAHMSLLKHILRYLKGTPELGLVFKQDGRTLEAYSDADFANCEKTRRFTTGYLLWYNEPVLWKSRRQAIVSLSSTEADL